MMGDDQRMHGGNTPGLVGGRGHERQEDAFSPEADAIGTPKDPAKRVAHGGHGPAGEDRTDAAPGESALGGDVATRSGTAATPKNERA